MLTKFLKRKLFTIYFSKSKKHTFTLVELLVVIAIIGILAALAIVAFHPALAKGRDSRRAMNLKTMTTALELYYSDEGSYPVVVDTNSISSNQGICLEQSTQFAIAMLTYMRNIPQDPSYVNTTYPEYCYWYHTTGNGSEYKISARVESSNYDPASQDGGTESNSYEVFAGNNANQLSRDYILVSKNSDNSYYFTRVGSVLNGKTAFYVMQYEAKYDTDGDGKGNDANTCYVTAGYDTWDWGKTGTDCPSSWSAGNVVSSPEGSPIAGITHIEALTACPAGFHLITNDEWMAMARDAEQVNSNWSNNSVGSGCLFGGNNSTDDTCGYDGANPEKGLGRNAKAKLILSNDQEIWDLAGNVWEHVSFTPSGADATHQELDQPDDTDVTGGNWYEFTVIDSNGAGTFTAGYTDGKAVFRPSGDTRGSSKGVGQIWTRSNSGDFTAHVFGRGGDWSNGAHTGAFALKLNYTAGGSDNDVGLRCAR